MVISRIYNFQRNFRRKLYFLFTTYYGRLQAHLGGFNIGKEVRFYGRSFLQKGHNGSAHIGNMCVFRSSPTSNLIGINRPCIISIHNNGRLVIGDKCGFSGTVIGCFQQIVLDDNVRCGANTLITDSDWHLDDQRSGHPKPVFIEKNVWLGAGVMVLKGVTIGENSVIGAGSVVTKDIPANVIAAGNPCMIIKNIEKN